MGKYGSINEFRAALNGIVGHAGGARSNPRPTSSNLGKLKWRVDQDGQHEASLPELGLTFVLYSGFGPTYVIAVFERTGRNRPDDGPDQRRAQWRSRSGNLRDAKAEVEDWLAENYPLHASVSRTPRARRNSPVRMLPGGGWEADTAEEMAALMQTMGPGRGGFGSTPRKAAAVRKPRAARKEKAAYSGELQDPGGPVSYSQAKFIGMSIGGMAAYCPQYVHEKVSHQQALIEMGLTKGAASAVIDVMKSRGVYMQRDPGSQAAARQILEEIGRVSCPVPNASLGQRRALNNPRRRR